MSGNLIKYLFPAVGILLCLGGFYWDKKMVEFRANSQTATGTVVKLISRTGSWAKAPVVRFKSSSGKIYSFRSNTFSNPPAYKIGEEVAVLYDPSDPEGSVEVDSFWAVRGVSVVLYIVGGMLIFIGLVFIYVLCPAKDSPDLQR